MTLTDLVRDGLFVQAVGLAAIALARTGGGEAEPLPPSTPEAARERVRREHGVRVVTPAEEGVAASKLPGGVYGFTNAPLTESPLFASQLYRAFEVHKTVDGECRLIVFATPDDAAGIRSADRPVEAQIYPDPYESATEALAIPFSRLSMKKLVTSREPGNWIAATVYPE